MDGKHRQIKALVTTNKHPFVSISSLLPQQRTDVTTSFLFVVFCELALDASFENGIVGPRPVEQALMQWAYLRHEVCRSGSAI